MFVKNLRLINFRNYEKLNIEFEKGFNVIYGDNAQGKTNILEAIFLCASGRSHRTSRDNDLVLLGKEGYNVRMFLEKKNNNTQIDVTFKKSEKKKIQINEIQQKKLGNLMGHLNAVIFSPEDLLIIKQGPSERRRFIDITLCQIKPSYFYDLQQYSKILVQRNSLLKELQNKKQLIETLEIWNNNLIGIGSRIMKVRHEFIKRLSEKAENKHGILTGGKERMQISYSPSFSINQFDDLEKIKEQFERSLMKVQQRELQKAQTLIGPQRDDYDILLDGLSLKMYGSQGQQRTAVLSMKLSEVDIMKEEIEEAPILLLDDVMSELDHERQGFLFHNLHDIQTFITCTEKDFFNNDANLKANYLKVSKGNIE